MQKILRCLLQLEIRKLGGYDFDKCIIAAVTEAAAEQGFDIQSDPVAQQDLQLKAEEAKKTLSAREKANIVLNIGGRPFKYTLTREDFADLIEGVLFGTISSMEMHVMKQDWNIQIWIKFFW